MTQRLGVIALVATIGLFTTVLVLLALGLLLTGQPVLMTLASTFVVLGAIAVFTVVMELRFGIDASRLGRLLDADDALPPEPVALRPSGRIVAEDADALFETYASAVRADPGSWSRWYRLGLVYDAAGDRRRARWAVRQAIRLERDERRTLFSA